jgi:hypothetical protein
VAFAAQITPIARHADVRCACPGNGVSYIALYYQ